MITSCDRLTAPVLARILNQECCALHIPGYYDRTAAERFANACLWSGRLENCRFADRDGMMRDTNTDRIGLALNETYGGKDESDRKEREEHYYGRAIDAIQEIRRMASSWGSPIDQLRLSLDELSPNGAMLAPFKGRRAFAGIVRVNRCPTNSDLGPLLHIDRLSDQICSFEVQLSAVVFLRVATKGGELEVWDISTEELLTHLRAHGQLVREQLRQPATICPEVGDLVIINARKPHAVRQVQQGTRVVQACFIGHKANQPLYLWS